MRFLLVVSTNSFFENVSFFWSPACFPIASAMGKTLLHGLMMTTWPHLTRPVQDANNPGKRCGRRQVVSSPDKGSSVRCLLSADGAMRPPAPKATRQLEPARKATCLLQPGRADIFCTSARLVMMSRLSATHSMLMRPELCLLCFKA